MKSTESINRLKNWWHDFGVTETDDLLTKETKNLIKIIGILMSIGGIIWGTICVILGLYTQSFIPFGYVLVTIINFIIFSRTQELSFTRITQIGASLLLPFALQWSLGGFVMSGGVMLWSLLGLISVITVYRNHKGNQWLVFYCILFIFTISFDSYSRESATVHIPMEISKLFMIVNFFCIPLFLFVIGRIRSNIDLKLKYQIEVKAEEIAIKNRELEVYAAHLARINLELESFVYVTSHDLKAPLRAVSSLVSFVIKDDYNNLSNEGKEMLELASQRIVLMDSLINGILNYCAIDKMNFVTSEVNSELVIKDVLKVIDIGQNVIIKINSELPIVNYDRTMMMQVFQNLISNAINHNGRKQISIDINCTENQKEYTFEVKDNGKGIAPTFLPRIFDLFQTTSRRAGSTGIGLSIVKRIVELNRGKIWVESTPERGSSFYFTIPKRIKNE